MKHINVHSSNRVLKFYENHFGLEKQYKVFEVGFVFQKKLNCEIFSSFGVPLFVQYNHYIHFDLIAGLETFKKS